MNWAFKRTMEARSGDGAVRRHLCKATLGIVLGLAVSMAATAKAEFLPRIASANGSDITFEDNSREVFVDVDGSGSISGGDILYGYLRFDSSDPTPTAGNDQIVAVFSQTFDASTFAAAPFAGGLTYSGTFVPTPAASPFSLNNLLPSQPTIDASAMAVFLDDASGFAPSLLTHPFASMAAAIAAIDAQGTARFSAGFGSGATNGDDFFAFNTVPLGGPGQPADFVATPGILPTLSTSTQLGTFGGGLTILDNFFGGNTVIFNESVSTSFAQLGTGGFFSGTFDVAVVNGNFGGTFDGMGNIQGGFMDFVDNTDVVLNATVVPEPSTIVAWAGFGALGLVAMRRRRNRK